MAKLPAFDKMSTAELEEWRAERKAEINELRDELRASNEEWHSRIDGERIADAIAAAERNLPDGMVIVPGPAAATLKGN